MLYYHDGLLEAHKGTDKFGSNATNRNICYMPQIGDGSVKGQGSK
jgi:hypothetical protein